jgi:tetratricopeptide (TPR) repeat protein
VTLDGSENTLNDAAYILAEHRAYLDLAEEWSQRSVAVVEKELNNLHLSDVGSNTWVQVTKLSHYWDTLGWILFQEGKIEAAEKYLRAAFQLNDDTTISFHLGRVFETQKGKDDAIELYLAALSAASPNAPLSDDAKEARRRLADLLGSEAQVDERLRKVHRGKSALRTVRISNLGRDQGIAQYTLLLDANSKVLELSATNSDDSLANLNEAVRATRVPQTFPDTTLQKLPRLSTLACAVSDEPCVLILLPLNTMSHMATTE